MRRWLAVALGVLALFGCGRIPTQVLVVFEADAAITLAGRRLHIEVVTQEAATRVWDIDLREGEEGATSFPVTLPLVPRDRDASRTYDVIADVLDESGVVIARQRVRSGYVAGELRELRVRFTGDCRDELCDRGTTCRAGRCVDACLEPAPRGEPSIRTCPTEQTDAGTDLDPTSCDDVHAGALFCDGFESALPGAWGGMRETRGFLTRLAAPVHRGEFALESRTTEGNAFVFVDTDAIADVSPDLYVRLYVYVPSGQDIVELNLIYAGEDADPFGGMELGLVDDGNVFVRGRPARMQLETDDHPVAWDRWVCLEAHVAMRPDSEGSVELWVDDEPRGRLENIDTFIATRVGGMNAGIPFTTVEQPPVRVIIDEVVADDERIGCD